MTTMANTCKHCLKPIGICRQQDDLLIRPLDLSRFNLTYDDRKIIPYTRYERAVHRLLGLYDKENDTYFTVGIPSYTYEETIAILPLCVFETEEDYRFIYAIRALSIWHIDDLSLEEEYIDILVTLISREIDHNFNS